MILRISFGQHAVQRRPIQGVLPLRNGWSNGGYQFGCCRAVQLYARISLLAETAYRCRAGKAIVCGYRNRECFRNAILFYLGGLDLYPRPASAHTTS